MCYGSKVSALTGRTRTLARVSSDLNYHVARTTRAKLFEYLMKVSLGCIILRGAMLTFCGVRLYQVIISRTR